MKNKIPSSGGRFRHAVLSTLNAVALCAAVSVYAQTPATSGTNPYPPSGSDSSTSTRAGSDRTRSSGSGISGSTTGSDATRSSTGAMTAGRADTIDMDGATLTRADRRFVTKASEMNIEELRLSEIAVRQASSPEVRAFAQQLVDDHTQAGTELSTLATRKSVALMRDDYDQRGITRLSKKTGRDFDQAYIDKMVDAHDDAVDLFEKTARNAKDPEVQALASKMLPKLQQHQQHAKSLEKTLK